MLKFLCVICLGFSFLGLAQTKRFDANVESSKIEWVGSKIIGGSNSGYVAVKSGTFQVDVQKKTVVSGVVEVNLNTITCSNIEDKTWNAKLVDHLKSDDFFSVAKYPTAKFSIQRISNGVATGELMIRGKKQVISFPVKVTLVKNDVLHIKVDKLMIDRTKFDIKYRSNSFFDNLQDKAIANEFELHIHLVADLY